MALEALVEFCSVYFSKCKLMNLPGYSFWTNNPAYHRVAAMHQIIFDIGYRKSVLKDGAINFIIQGLPACCRILLRLIVSFPEYERSMKELGFLSIDAEMLCYGIPIPWYWQVLEMVVEIPLVRPSIR